MEINGISPLPHYYEEIYSNQVGLPLIGMRGDKNYLFYSKNGLGAGYYEQTEEKLATDSVYNFFKQYNNRSKFLFDAKKMIATMQSEKDAVDKIDFSKLDTKTIAKLFIDANELHGQIFSYYIVSQPYRMRKYEEQIRLELRKRVASSRIDSYMNILATSTKPSRITLEELAWLRFLKKYKSKYKSIPHDLGVLRLKFPDVYHDFMGHFDEYKVLTLGDGNWDYAVEHFQHSLEQDSRMTLEEIEEKLLRSSKAAKKSEKERTTLIDELYLNKETVQDLDFLAEMGHMRLCMRIEGWVPFIGTIIKLDIALSKSLGHPFVQGSLLNFMHPSEYDALVNHGDTIPINTLIDRRGSEDEFLIHHDNGVYKIYFGVEACGLFKKLVPPIDHTNVMELKGMTAVRGKITGKACVYRWGDDISKKQKIIQDNPILIAGQTRPAMMPIIRQAKGIVTDEGGVTSHAAIVSRELGIPSVIGTIYATQVFKDGDLVELDADNGIVRKIT